MPYTVRIEFPDGRVLLPKFRWKKDARDIARVYREYAGAKTLVLEETPV